MLFLTAALALVAGTAVQAATINVEVGTSGNTYTPDNTPAAVGDVVVFTFKNGGHTVTQSSFADPCNPLANGLDSGPRVVQGAAPATLVYNFTVNGTDPLWFYCKTGAHCKGGMVFAINPTTDKTYAAFKATAQGSGSANGTASAAPSGSGTASGSSPAATTSGAASGRTSVGIGAVAAALLFGGMTAI